MKTIIAVSLWGLLLASALAQTPAFVEQASPGGGALLEQQQGPPSPSYVQQVPEGAALPTARPAPTPKPVMFIETTKLATDLPVIVNDDDGIVPFAPGKRPALPVLSQGVGVSIISQVLVQLPDVGAGAVVR